MTLCLIKPHILRDQAVGEVINKILEEGYGLGAIYSSHLTNAVAEEVLDVYVLVVVMLLYYSFCCERLFFLL